MDDLDRLFRYLVEHLAHSMPDRLQKPLQVSELYQRLVPYRTHKRELGFESIEDYEVAMLRLLAGERGYARVEPPDVQEALAAEAGQVSPDPGAFREFAAASVLLNRDAIRRLVDHDAEYAPPEQRRAPPQELVPEAITHAAGVSVESERDQQAGLEIAGVETRELVFEPVEKARRCSHCDAELPRGRHAAYCPYCGEQLEPMPCPQCGEVVEPIWNYCLGCGRSRHRPRITDAP